MTIPDMAKAFTMLDKVPPPSSNPDPNPIGSNGPVGGGRPNPNRRDTPAATIACNNGKWQNTKNGMQGDDPELCNHPVFTINLPAITLPNIAQTADQVLKRIIPAPGGDCKIVVYPEEQSFPNYGLIILGSASAIACGLNVASTLTGNIIPPDGDTTTSSPTTATVAPTTTPFSNSTVPISSGSQSTNGENGAFVAAPPAQPFAPITSSDAVCIGFSNTQNTLCLPAGTYGNQDGGLGFTLSDANSITVPGPGFSLTAEYYPEPDPQHGAPGPGMGGGNHITKRSIRDTYSGSTSNNDDLDADFKGISNPNSKGTFVIHSPSDPPSVCLFT